MTTKQTFSDDRNGVATQNTDANYLQTQNMECLRPSEFGFYSSSIIPQYLIEQACREISNYTISFVLNLAPTGAGTLVNASGIFGILTAHHVGEVLCKSGDNEIGINISNHPHGLYVPASHLEHVEVGKSDHSRSPESGPDLSLLKIRDPNLLGTLHSKKSFYHADQRSFSRFAGIPMGRLRWFIAGAPAEFSRRTRPDPSGEEMLQESHFFGEARFLTLIPRDGDDYVRLELLAGAHNYPSNYQGVSGGGIWLVPFALDPRKGPSSVSYEAPFLAGVAFHQSALEGKQRVITGHGPTSIYDRLPQFLADRAA